MIKKFFLCFFLCITTFAFGVPLQDHTIEKQALSELLRVFDIEDGSDMIEKTQKEWLRNPNEERWEMKELPKEKRHFVLEWADKNGLFTAWKPSDTFYDKAIILGAATPRMKKRLDYLQKLWEEGVRFEEIVWLTGDRPLDPKVDVLYKNCKTESDAAQFLWKIAKLPKSLKNLPIIFLPTPMKTVDETVKRPNTADTITTWLKCSPNPCKVVFISDQPFCGYQFSVIKQTIPENYLFDVVGEKQLSPANYPSSAAIILDTVARWIYNERLNQD